jgi:hypothetical protein
MTTGTVQKKSKNRPCDRCRLKKRKCDGNLPCATCLRCRTGDAVCTYNNEKYSNLIRISKNDDASIFKLQYLENVLNSIVPNTNASIFTVPQQTFQFTSFGPVQPLEIEFHQFQSNMSMNGFTDMQIDPNHLQHQYQTSLDPFFSNLEPPTFPTQVEDSLENHLIGLSYLYYAGYTVNKNLRPVELCQRYCSLI